MIPKLDTPIKPIMKPTSSRTMSASITNEDLMSVFMSFKADIVASSKGISDLQTIEYGYTNRIVKYLHSVDRD